MLRKYQSVRWGADIGVSSLRIVLEQTSRARRSATLNSAAMPGVPTTAGRCRTDPAAASPPDIATLRQIEGPLDWPVATTAYRHCQEHGGRAEPLRARREKPERYAPGRGTRSSPARPSMDGVPQLPAHPASPLWNPRWPMEPAGYAVTTHQRRKHSQCFAVVNRCAVAQTLVSARWRIALEQTPLI